MTERWPRLDDALPTWQHRERHRIAVVLPPAAVLRAAEDVTWAEVPVFRALMTARFSGGRFAPDDPVLNWFMASGFAFLDRTDDEVVVGAVQQLSLTPVPVLMADPSPEALCNFDQPGHVKMAFNFLYDGAALSTETRVLATDWRSRRQFDAYWLFIRAGSGIIRQVWLRAIRQRARRVAEGASSCSA